MVIIESGASAAGESALLRSMFEDRKRVFVDLLKWDLPVLANRFEMDEFDSEHATYIIIASGDGDHLGSARLLPTVHRHLLGAIFPQLCAAPPPSGPDVMEITRFCLSPRTNAAARRQTRNQLVTALCSFGLDTGIRTYTGVAEMSWLQQVLAFGWDCRPLGPAVATECGTIASLAIEIDGRTPARLRANGIWDEAPAAERAIARAA